MLCRYCGDCELFDDGACRSPVECDRFEDCEHCTFECPDSPFAFVAPALPAWSCRYFRACAFPPPAPSPLSVPAAVPQDVQKE